MSNMSANYSENLISERLGSFRFQPRDGSLRMKVISNASLSQIIRRGDHRSLQTLLNNTNIVNADVAGEDFDFHSSDFLVKLFQICQLSLEFTQTKCKMLEEELNEVDRFSKITAKNLRMQDELVATLRDELYHCKEALKRAEEQQSQGQGVPRVDQCMFPSQERRINLSSSESSDSDDDDDSESIISDTNIKLHVVSPTHGLHIPLIVDEMCTIQTLQNKILDDKREGCSIDFEQWSLYYKDQKVQPTGTLKDYQITNDSALVIIPTSPNNMNMESKLDDIKSMLNQVTRTLECQAASQESNSELLVKEMNSCNEMLEEVLRGKYVDRTGDVDTITSPSDTKSPSTEASIDEQNNSIHLQAEEVPEVAKQSEKMELRVDTTAECQEWPFGLDFDTFAALPKEINVTENASDGGSPSSGTYEKASQTVESSNSPTQGESCNCSGEEVCDECVNGSSPRSSEAVATTCVTKNNDNDEVDEHFTFSVFDNIEAENFTAADFDYSCDKSDFESLHIGAKEPNDATDTDLHSVEISLEEFASGLDADEDKKEKKNRRILKKLAFKSKWKKLMCKKKAASVDF